MSNEDLFVGLMSGTSLDGIDCALVRAGAPAPTLLATRYAGFDEGLRDELLALNAPGPDETGRSALAANAVARAYAETVRAMLAEHGIGPERIAAIGAHGQTVRHRPDLGYTVQLLNGALLAELTGVRVVCDFRSRDIAAGGLGAPLVPAFHAAAFRDPRLHRVVVNIGGIANLTDLPPAGPVRGFDSGPGNLLLDGWCQAHTGERYDDGGRWAMTGRILSPLLERLAADAYFARRPPKATGRDDFHMNWLRAALDGGERPEDVQATLMELTAATIAGALADHCPGAAEVYVCGGGSRNDALMARLAVRLAPRRVASTQALGVDPDWVEAMAFAWLAGETLGGRAGNLPDVTGARGPRVLGAIHAP